MKFSYNCWRNVFICVGSTSSSIMYKCIHQWIWGVILQICISLSHTRSTKTISAQPCELNHWIKSYPVTQCLSFWYQISTGTTGADIDNHSGTRNWSYCLKGCSKVQSRIYQSLSRQALTSLVSFNISADFLFLEGHEDNVTTNQVFSVIEERRRTIPGIPLFSSVKWTYADKYEWI